MYQDPSGEFVITLATILISVAVSAIIGATIGTGIAVYNDYKDDGIINFSIGIDNYIANILGSAVAASGIGIALVLGAAAGTAYIMGSSATLLTSSGISISFGTAMILRTGAAFLSGMGGYTIRTSISSTQSYRFSSMIIDGLYNAANGMISVFGGYVVGLCGFRMDFVGQVVSRGVRLATPILQNIYTIGIKAMLSLIKSGY